MSQQKTLENWVTSLTEDELYQVALVYLRVVENVKNAYISNQPYDSALDILPLDTNKIYCQYQATTCQIKKFQSKLKSDLLGALSNVEKHGLPEFVKYFYSKSISPDDLFKKQKIAKDDFGLTLDIVDSKKIARAGLLHTEIAELLKRYSSVEDYITPEVFFQNQSTKTYYELLSSGDGADIKECILNSVILGVVGENDGASLETIKQHISEKLDLQLTDKIVRHRLEKLSANHRIKFQKDPEAFKLHEAYSKKREELNKLYEIEQADLLKELSILIDKHSLNLEIRTVIELLVEVYSSSYDMNVQEMLSMKSSVEAESVSAKRFIARIVENSDANEDEAIEIARDFLRFADNNDLISLSSMVNVFSVSLSNNNFDRFIAYYKANHSIYLDTNFLVFYVISTYLKHHEIEVDDRRIRIASTIGDLVEHDGLELRLYSVYVQEVGKMFHDASQLTLFENHENVFQGLGGSNNPIWQLFQRIPDESKPAPTFREFLKDLGFYNPNSIFTRAFSNKLKDAIESYGVNIFQLKKYDESEIQLAQDIIQEYSKHKSPLAARNDALAVLGLLETDTRYNPMATIFCTWDKSLFESREKLIEVCGRDRQTWLLFTPSKLIDHFSLLNFRVGQSTLSQNLLYILNKEHDLQEKTASILDSLIQIVDSESKPSFTLMRTLSRIKKNQIQQLENIPDENEYVNRDPSVSPIDMVIESFMDKIRESDIKLATVRNMFRENVNVEKFIDIAIKISDSFNSDKVYKSELLDPFIQEMKTNAEKA